MKRGWLIIGLVAFLAFGVASLHLTDSGSGFSSGFGDATPRSPKVSLREQEESSPARAKTYRETGPPSAEALQILKSRWSSLEENAASARERDLLARESAETLLSSSELFDLISFLEDKGISTGPQGINSYVIRLFSSSRAADCRDLLISERFPNTAEAIGMLERWSWHGGRHCPASEVEGFTELLRERDERLAEKAVFGHAVARAEEDPLGAVSEVLLEVEKGLDSVSSSVGVVDDVLEVIPDDAQFSDLEEMISGAAGVESQKVEQMRSRLFERWASASPDSALDYVRLNRDRLSPTLARHTGLSIFKRGDDAALEWLEGLPDDDISDHVFKGAVEFLMWSDPDRARDIALRINDESLRSRALQRVVTSRRVQAGEH